MNIKICLDAGHYGKYNRSPVVPAYYESDMNWKLHLMLKEVLERYGIEVVTTRTNQATDKALADRGKASKGCNLFLSIHSNACDTESVDYPVAICMLDDNKVAIDDESRLIGDRLAAVVASVMGTKQAGRVSTRKSDDDRDGNGILDDEYYGVLHGAKMVGTPGIIMEHSFHTNAAATQWLSNDDNLRKLAESEGAMLAEYFSLTGNEEQTEKDDNKSESDKAQEVGTRYRVQVGAYDNKEKAEAQKANVIKAGFDAIIVEEDNMHKVQAGLYAVKANADAQLQRVMAAGFDAFIKILSGTGAEVPKRDITVGDTVTVLRNVTYTGAPFRAYFDKYDVIQVKGDRAVIGIGNTTTCAIHKDNIALV